MMCMITSLLTKPTLPVIGATYINNVTNGTLVWDGTD